MVDRGGLEDEGRRIRSRARTVGGYFATEKPLLKPLPTELVETGRLFTPRVDRYSQIATQTSRYSVPARLIGRTVRVMLHAHHLIVYDQGQEAARHERLSAKARSR